VKNRKCFRQISKKGYRVFGVPGNAILQKALLKNTQKRHYHFWHWRSWYFFYLSCNLRN